MRFLIDECCHRLFAEALRNAGHDVRYAVDTDHRASDLEISAKALSEDRLIVTADYDFGEIAVRDRRPVPGIVILAPSGAAIIDRAARLTAVVLARGEALRGTLTVIEDRRLRVRALEPE